jgi:proline iminopeptidase
MALLLEHHYVHHVLRLPTETWPDPVNRGFAHINPAIYVPMQGPSELGRIEVPTLVIGAQHDTMDPEHMAWMASAVQRGRHLHCPNGSHMAMYDDQEVYVRGLIGFVHDVDAGRF